MKAHLFSPLKIRSFRLLFAGQIFSDLGSWLDFIALNAILVFQWKMGPGEMGVFLVIYGLPWIVCGPLLAVWTDRYSSTGAERVTAAVPRAAVSAG